jgi:hypothetical protein
MATVHIIGCCKAIPSETRENLLIIKAAAKSSDGGGKKYWSKALKRLGVDETESQGLVRTKTK